jgi:hypothetical protein
VATLDSFRFSRLMSDRHILFAEFQAKMRKQQEAEEKFAKDLLAVVPKRLRRFVREQEVIEVLLKYGTYSDRYGYNLPGLRTYESVLTAIKELRAAWKKNVVITIDAPGENGRVSIRYFVAPHIY